MSRTADARIDFYAPPKSFQLPKWLGGLLALTFLGMIGGSGYLFVRLLHPAVIPSPESAELKRAAAAPAPETRVPPASELAAATEIAPDSELAAVPDVSNGVHHRRHSTRHKPMKHGRPSALNSKRTGAVGHAETRSKQRGRDEIDRLLGM